LSENNTNDSKVWTIATQNTTPTYTLLISAPKTKEKKSTATAEHEKTNNKFFIK